VTKSWLQTYSSSQFSVIRWKSPTRRIFTAGISCIGKVKWY